MPRRSAPSGICHLLELPDDLLQRICLLASPEGHLSTRQGKVRCYKNAGGKLVPWTYHHVLVCTSKRLRRATLLAHATVLEEAVRYGFDRMEAVAQQLLAAWLSVPKEARLQMPIDLQQVAPAAAQELTELLRRDDGRMLRMLLPLDRGEQLTVERGKLCTRWAPFHAAVRPWGAAGTYGGTYLQPSAPPSQQQPRFIHFWDLSIRKNGSYQLVATHERCVRDPHFQGWGSLAVSSTDDPGFSVSRTWWVGPDDHWGTVPSREKWEAAVASMRTAAESIHL